MAFSNAQIYAYAKNPSSIPAPGTYGEGQVINIREMLKQLRDNVSTGKMTLLEYNTVAAPLVQQAYQSSTAIGGGGSRAANSVVPYWQDIMNNGYAAVRGGQVVSTIPFSAQEYAKLDPSTLPTQEDVKNGLFDPTSAPIQRYAPSPTPTNTTGGTGTQPTPTTNTGEPLPQVNPSIPAGVDTRTDQGLINLTGNQNAQLLQEILNKQYDINQKAVGQYKTDMAGVPDVYKNEGNNQYDQLMGLADQQKSARAQALTDLAGVLADQQLKSFNRAVPNLAEQANTSGIYRSTGFGDILARKYTELEQDRQNQLALQGISDRDQYLSAQQAALGNKLGYSGQAAQQTANTMETAAGAGSSALQSYANGLSDVGNTAIGAANAGLQRSFSLQDFITQQAAAQKMADSMKPQGASGKASPNTQAWIQGSLGAINTGARAYQAGQTAGRGK